MPCGGVLEETTPTQKSEELYIDLQSSGVKPYQQNASSSRRTIFPFNLAPISLYKLSIYTVYLTCIEQPLKLVIN